MSTCEDPASGNHRAFRGSGIWGQEDKEELMARWGRMGQVRLGWEDGWMSMQHAGPRQPAVLGDRCPSSEQ